MRCTCVIYFACSREFCGRRGRNRSGLSLPMASRLREKVDMVSVPRFCLRRQRLMEKFVKAVQDHGRLRAAQIDALVLGDRFSFERELADAKKRRDRAKYAFLEHAGFHECR